VRAYRLENLINYALRTTLIPPFSQREKELYRNGIKSGMIYKIL